MERGCPERSMKVSDILRREIISSRKDGTVPFSKKPYSARTERKFKHTDDACPWASFGCLCKSLCKR